MTRATPVPTRWRGSVSLRSDSHHASSLTAHHRTDPVHHNASAESVLSPLPCSDEHWLTPSLRPEMKYVPGLTSYQALAAATRAPAEYLGRQKEFGTVEIGKRADLLLVDGNPLEDVANARKSSGVALRGQWLPAADLDAMLTSIANRHLTPSK
jgi:hypothetical protein